MPCSFSSLFTLSMFVYWWVSCYVSLVSQLVGGVGLSSLACFLSLYLNVPLPSDTLFLGEVECRGRISHPLPLNEHYLDLCLEEGFTRIVGSFKDLQVLEKLVEQDRYSGIELIGLDRAIDIVPNFFQLLPAGPVSEQPPEDAEEEEPAIQPDEPPAGIDDSDDHGDGNDDEEEEYSADGDFDGDDLDEKLLLSPESDWADSSTGLIDCSAQPPPFLYT